MGISPHGNMVSNFDDCHRFTDISCSLAALRLFETPPLPSFLTGSSCTRWWMTLHASCGGGPHRSVGEVSFWHGVSLAYASYHPSLLVMFPTLGSYCRRLFSYDQIKQMIVCVCVLRMHKNSTEKTKQRSEMCVCWTLSLGVIVLSYTYIDPYFFRSDPMSTDNWDPITSDVSPYTGFDTTRSIEKATVVSTYSSRHEWHW